MSTSNFRVLLSGLLSAGLLLGLASSALAQDKAAEEQAAPAKAETLKIDPVHSNMLFRIQHFNAGYVYGEFLGESGVVHYDPANPDKTSFTVEILTDSVDTHSAQRNKHLKSADFFNAKQFPKLTFKSTAVKKRGPDTYEVTGDLTLHGKTHKITTIAQMTGSGSDPGGNFRRGFFTTFNINRSDYDMNFMQDGGLSDNVKLILSIEAIRQDAK